jgi:hypothetical protein
MTPARRRLRVHRWAGACVVQARAGSVTLATLLIAVYGLLLLLSLRAAWLNPRDWTRWLALACLALAYALLLAGRLTEGRQRPAWFHGLMTRKPTLRTQLLLMLAIILLAFFSGLFIPGEVRTLRP